MGASKLSRALKPASALAGSPLFNFDISAQQQLASNWSWVQAVFPEGQGRAGLGEKQPARDFSRRGGSRALPLALPQCLANDQRSQGLYSGWQSIRIICIDWSEGIKTVCLIL